MWFEAAWCILLQKQTVARMSDAHLGCMFAKCGMVSLKDHIITNRTEAFSVFFFWTMMIVSDNLG